VIVMGRRRRRVGLGDRAGAGALPWIVRGVDVPERQGELEDETRQNEPGTGFPA
jgi:hypothetical protein